MNQHAQQTAEAIADAVRPAPIPSHLRGEPVRTIRVSDRLWNDVVMAAAEEGLSTSDFIRSAIGLRLEVGPEPAPIQEPAP